MEEWSCCGATQHKAGGDTQTVSENKNMQFDFYLKVSGSRAVKNPKASPFSSPHWRLFLLSSVTVCFVCSSKSVMSKCSVPSALRASIRRVLAPLLQRCLSPGRRIVRACKVHQRCGEAGLWVQTVNTPLRCLIGITHWALTHTLGDSLGEFVSVLSSFSLALLLSALDWGQGSSANSAVDRIDWFRRSFWR